LDVQLTPKDVRHARIPLPHPVPSALKDRCADTPSAAKVLLPDDFGCGRLSDDASERDTLYMLGLRRPARFLG
jgi:hypothetical protein